MVTPFEEFTLYETGCGLKWMGCMVNLAFAESFLYLIHAAMVFSGAEEEPICATHSVDSSVFPSK